MPSLADVAKAMNAEAGSKLSLVDVAKAEAASAVLTKPLTLLDVAKQEMHQTSILLQLAQEIDEEARSDIQVVLEKTAKEVIFERHELRSEVVTKTATGMQQEEQQAAEVLRTNAMPANTSKREPTSTVVDKMEGDADGYSIFENNDQDSPTKSGNNASKKPTESITSSEKHSEDGQGYEAPPRTTPSDSKEAKEFLRSVYRAEKYQVRYLLDDTGVDADIADQHGWSGLHWAASQNHSDILELLLQKGAEVNAVDQITGWTALHVAVVREAISCISVLLSSGANPKIKDLYGDTVVDCLQAAGRKKKTKMLQLLQEHTDNH